MESVRGVMRRWGGKRATRVSWNLYPSISKLVENLGFSFRYTDSHPRIPIPSLTRTSADVQYGNSMWSRECRTFSQTQPNKWWENLIPAPSIYLGPASCSRSPNVGCSGQRQTDTKKINFRLLHSHDSRSLTYRLSFLDNSNPWNDPRCSFKRAVSPMLIMGMDRNDVWKSRTLPNHYLTGW